MSSSAIALLAGFAFTKTVHSAPYDAISPSRPKLSQTGRTVLITGGHTGIGYAIARAFAHASAKIIIIVGRRDNLVSSAASRLASEFPSTKTLGHSCDVADLVSVDRLWKDLANDSIFVDVVVLNAAMLSAGPILDLSRDAVWDEYLVNVRTQLDFVERLYKQPGAEDRPKVSADQCVARITTIRLTLSRHLSIYLLWPSMTVNLPASILVTVPPMRRDNAYAADR